MKIAYITAGAGGMYCGSCLRDNTLAAAIHQLGHDCLLVPCYTPIRTDEEDFSGSPIFLGGLSVYLEQKVYWLRRMPGWLNRFLSQPWLLRWVAGRAVKTQASELAEMTISLLQGANGHQKAEVDRITSWLATQIKPDILVLTNALMSGIIPALQSKLNIPVVVTLQGDDIFLEELPADARDKCKKLIQRNCQNSSFLTTCQYYTDFMNQYLGLPLDKFRAVLPGIQLAGFPTTPPPAKPAGEPLAIGYLGRIAPEKGLHVLVDAINLLVPRSDLPKFRLRIAGYLPPHRKEYLDEQRQKAEKAGWADRFSYEGEPDRQGKIAFLSSLDLFSMPTIYKEPKGLSILEAQGCGVPVVQPEHGSFPEILKMTDGGKLFPPKNPEALAGNIADLLRSPNDRIRLGERGQEKVHSHFTAQRMAKETLAVLEEVMINFPA